MPRPIYTICFRADVFNEVSKAFEFNFIKTKYLGTVGKHAPQLAVYPKDDAQELRFWRICHAQQICVEDGTFKEKT